MKTFARNICLGASFLGLTAMSALAADAAAGKAVYDTKCKTCHAADGAGNQGLAKALKATIKPMSDPSIQSKSDADLKAVVTGGLGKMKPIAGVAGADLDNVVAFVRTFKK
jgi:mono/diheme cytochrome c family protein